MSDHGGDGQGFEQRLRAAESAQAAARAKATAARSDTGASDLGIGLRVGVELVSALAVAVLIGWALDRWLGTMPVFIGLFVLLGGAAGVLNVWRVMAPRKD